MLSVVTLFGFFAVPTKVSAMTCTSATLSGTVITGTPPAHARFEYGTDYNTVVNGGGTTTAVQIFDTEGTFPIQQFISGLTENTTYYNRLVVTNDYGTQNSGIDTFTTPSCTQPVTTCRDTSANNYGGALPCTYNAPTCQDPSALNYHGTLPCQYQQVCQDTTALNYHGSLPCQYNNYVQVCQDPSAINYHGTLPCQYNNYIQTCQDPSANNYRGILPCQYNNYIQACQDPSALNYRGVLPCQYNNYVNNRPTVVVYADQTTVPYNGTSTIRWITTNATSCYASGGSFGWAGAKSIGPGSFYTGSLTSSKTYTLTCYNNSQSATDSETVTVRGQVAVNPRPTPTSLVLITSSVDRNQPIVPTIDNTRPHPGDEINYTVSYQNIGNASITNLSLRIDLPAEVDYISSNPSGPTISGNTLVFSLGTLKANGQGTVTVRTRVQDDIAAGTDLNFPAVLSYIDPSGLPASVNANVSAKVWSEAENQSFFPLGANVFGTGFLPTSLFGWLFLIILILLLVYLAKYLFDQSFRKKTTTVIDQPSGKKTTTTIVQ